MTRPSLVRAISSVGRAPRLHRGCRRFEPVIAHHVTAFFANDGKAHAHAPALSAPPREFRPLRQPEMIPVSSEEHTSDLQSLMRLSYAVFGLNTNTDLLSHRVCFLCLRSTSSHNTLTPLVPL